MNNDLDETAAYKKMVRENMDLKETTELIEIWRTHDTDDWTPEALEVVRELLVERGEDLNNLIQEDEGEEKDEEEPAPFTGKGNAENLPDWALDAIGMRPPQQKKLINSLSSSDAEEDTAADIECIRCGASIPWDSKVCPQCGLDLYPESSEEEEA
jgi:hypothetical protein